jgi:hypothetical protein
VVRSTGAASNHGEFRARPWLTTENTLDTGVKAAALRRRDDIKELPLSPYVPIDQDRDRPPRVSRKEA